MLYTNDVWQIVREMLMFCKIHLLHYFRQDFAWLELMNESRIKDGRETISEDVFELAMDRFEKESIFQCEFETGEDGRVSTAAAEEDAACSVCGSGDSDNDNNILFCDLCNIAIHQVDVHCHLVQ